MPVKFAYTELSSWLKVKLHRARNMYRMHILHMTSCVMFTSVLPNLMITITWTRDHIISPIYRNCSPLVSFILIILLLFRYWIQENEHSSSHFTLVHVCIFMLSWFQLTSAEAAFFYANKALFAPPKLGHNLLCWFRPQLTIVNQFVCLFFHFYLK